MSTTTPPPAWTYQSWTIEHLDAMENWNADTRRTKFQDFEAHEDELRADLAKRKVPELRKLADDLGAQHTKDLKKAELVAKVLDRMARQYVPGTIRLRPWQVTSRDKPQTLRQAVKEHLAALTDAVVDAERRNRARHMADLDEALTHTMDESRPTDPSS